MVSPSVRIPAVYLGPGSGCSSLSTEAQAFLSPATFTAPAEGCYGIPRPAERVLGLSLVLFFKFNLGVILEIMEKLAHGRTQPTPLVLHFFEPSFLESPLCTTILPSR